LLSKSREVEVLKILSNIPGVPTLVTEGKDFIVIMPAGYEFVRFTGTQIKDFVQMLKHVHYRKIIHRDIRPSNLILHNDHVYLIDWGFAVDDGKTEQFRGGLWCAANEILTSVSGLITSKPQHDLIMLLKMIHGITTGSREIIVEKFDLKTQEGRNGCAQFWNIQLKGFLWSMLLTCCENLEYDELAEKLSNLFVQT